jgi:hypothetical protein
MGCLREHLDQNISSNPAMVTGCKGFIHCNSVICNLICTVGVTVFEKDLYIFVKIDHLNYIFNNDLEQFNF